MRKILIVLTFFVMNLTLEGQSVTKNQLPTKGKFVLMNGAESSTMLQIVDRYHAFEKVMNPNEQSCIMIQTDFATTFFLNQWWLMDIGQDSLNELLIEKCLSCYADGYYRGDSEDDGFTLSFLKRWKKTFTQAQRQNIHFKSMYKKQSLEEYQIQFAILLKYLTKDIKDLDVEFQSYLDALDAELEVSEIKTSSVQLESDVESENDISIISSERFTIPFFLRNIDQLDSVLYPQIDSKLKSIWKEFVAHIRFINQLNNRNNYYGLDDSKVEVQLNYLNHYLTEISELINLPNTYYFWINVKDFFNQNLIPKSSIESTLDVKDDMPLYSTLVDLFPKVEVNRYRVMFDANSDSLNLLKKSELQKYGTDDSFQMLFVQIDSTEINLDPEYSAVDSTVSLDNEIESVYYEAKKSFSIESSYKRFYNNINEMLEIVNPGMTEMQHISFVGGSLVFNEVRNDGNKNAYKINYHQTYSPESLNQFWGQMIGFQIDGGLYANRFMDLSLLTNYTLGEFTYTKLPSGGDNFVVNPQRLYQISNSFFTVGTGLNLRVKLSVLYMFATGGYQWDLSDGRWKYEGEFINSLGKLKMNGGYFELGVGLNFSIK